MKKNAIVTASDSKFGDFLIDHWLKSLKTNVNLKDIDIVILDYGLSDTQKKRLFDVTVVECVRDGHVVNLRYRDLVQICDMGYEQLMITDSGDIIFQTDISNIFNITPENLRAVVESMGSIRYDRVAIKSFKRKFRKKIIETLSGKELINVGVLVGPNKKLRAVCNEFVDMLADMNSFGPDTVGINYLFYREGFTRLNHIYNFLVLNYWNEPVSLKDRQFYSKAGELISVVHNAGAIGLFRPILNFGYQRENMRINPTYYIIRPFTRFINVVLRLLVH